MQCSRSVDTAWGIYLCIDSYVLLSHTQDEDDEFADDISKQEQYEVLKDLAEKLGYDDISELIQGFSGYTPVANQQDLTPLDRDDDSQKPYPHQQNLQDPDPQKPIVKRPDPLRSYPHNSYPHSSDSQNSYPHNSDPADPYQPPAHPQAVDSLNTDTGDEDESVDGISTHLLQDVLNQLLNDEQEADPVDQQSDGDETHRYDKPQSNPRYKSQDRDDPAWPGKERNKSYLDELLDRLGDTNTEKQYDSRYYDSKPGNRQDGEWYDRYGDDKRDPVDDQRDRWLNNLYRSPRTHLDDAITRRHFIQKRDTLTNTEQTNHNEAFKSSEKATNQRQRFTRHSGSHDGGGLQRLISTGTLAPVLTGQGASSDESIDLIFATYWFYPSSTRVSINSSLESKQTSIW